MSFTNFFVVLLLCLPYFVRSETPVSVLHPHVDGRYFEFSESKEYANSTFVFAHKGNLIEANRNGTNISSLPGFYHFDKRFEFSNLQINDNKVHLATRHVGGIQFRFSGVYSQYIHPETGIRYKLMGGTITRIERTKVIRSEKIVFMTNGETID